VEERGEERGGSGGKDREERERKRRRRRRREEGVCPLPWEKKSAIMPVTVSVVGRSLGLELGFEYGLRVRHTIGGRDRDNVIRVR